MTRLAFISDTHLHHTKVTQFLTKKAGIDILVHCGDFCEYHGTLGELGTFADWCAMLLKKGYVKHIVVVAGNHDEILDETCPLTRKGWPEGPAMARDRFRRAGVIYLQDGAATVEGLVFYGAPWVGYCGDFAFQTTTPGEDERAFNHIRGPIDVLVTHSPPKGILDLMIRKDGYYDFTGSPALRRAIERVKPRIHAFGHIHPRRGLYVTEFGTLCLNAALFNADGKPKNPPIIVDLKPRISTE